MLTVVSIKMAGPVMDALLLEDDMVLVRPSGLLTTYMRMLSAQT